MFSADLGGVAASSTPSSNDPPFQKVALLLHGDGTNGAQNNTFVDSSSNNFTITRNGNATQGTFTPFSQAPGYWSNYFDGSNYISTPSSTAFNLGTGDFTIECWFYISGNSATNNNGNRDACLFDIGATGMMFNILGSSTTTGTGLQLYKSTDTSVNIQKTVTVAQNTWHHFAAVKASNSINLYLDGVAQGTATSDTTTWGGTTAQTGYIGHSNFSGYSDNFIGYISNLRLVKGTAIYTSDFTPSTAPLTAVSGTVLLTCQSNRFVDNSSNNFTITRNGDTKVTAFSPFAPSAAYSASTNGGSAYFDGSGDYLSVGTAINLATNDFTIEAWLYKPSYSGSNESIFASLTSGSFSMGWYNATTFQISFPYVAYIAQITYTTPTNAWFHVAVTKASNVYKVFINGTQIGTSVTNTTSIASGSYTIGSAGAAQNIIGYMSDFRLLVGTALYTSNFTPPTAPLTAVTNTQLLLNCTNAGIYDNSGKNDIETVGNAQISTSVKKYGTGSLAFDGTGAWLYLADRPNIQFGTGNFTIEGWLYLGATGAAQGIVGKGTGTTGWLFSVNSSNQLVFTDGSTATTGSTALTGSTWYHVAVVRNGTATGNLKIYLNGTADATSSGAVTTSYTQTNALYVGADRTGGSNFNGYIDDLRITQGQALYTSNFTPPTQAFPNV